MEQRQFNTLRMARGVIAHFDADSAVWEKKTVLVSVLNVVRALVNGIVQSGLTQQEMMTNGYTLDKDQQLVLMGALTEPLVRGLRAMARLSGNQALLHKVDFAPSELVRGPEQECVNRCQVIHDAASTHEASLGDYGVSAAMISGQQVAIDTFKPLAGLRDAVGAKRQAATATIPDLVAQLRTQLPILDDLTANLVEGADFKAAYRELRATVDTRGGRSKSTSEENDGSDGPDAPSVG
jgi:hypothetical protein